MPPPNISRGAAASRRKPRQQTLEAMLSRARAAQPRALGSSPGTAQSVDDDTENKKNMDSSEDEDDLPICRHPSRASRALFQADSNLPSRDKGLTTVPVAPGPFKRRAHVVVEDSEDEGGAGVKNAAGDDDDDDDNDDDDGDDGDIRPAKRRRQTRKTVQSSSDNEEGSSEDEDKDEDDDDLVVLTPQPKSTPLQRSSQSRSLRKRVPPSARSARQRHMELLRRRRMGEKVTTSDLEEEESEEEEGGIALYDKDPNHVALSDFEDDEEEEDDDRKKGGEEEEEEEQGGGEEKEEEEEDEKKKKREEDAVQFSKIMKLGRRRLGDDDDDGYDDYDDDLTGQLGDEALAEEDDMDDFIDDSHVGLIGAPDGGVVPDAEAKRRRAVEHEMAMLRREMPLQFTFQAHKPLRSHFKDAVEWLVHRRVNRPTDEDENDDDDDDGDDGDDGAAAFASYSNDEVYRVAWDRLDREIAGLAQSRFISSTWTPEFHSALRARPYMDSFNLRPGRSGGGGGGGGGSGNIYFAGAEENVCHACGRTNHPASYRVEFSGKAYDSKTLDDLEEEEEDDDDDDGNDDDDHASVDMNGNTLPPTTRQWYVGAVCHSNAETAHGLLHWRRALADWVEEKLVQDRVLKRLENDENLATAAARRDFANQIVDGWEANGTINSLFRDFQRLLEEAQVKSTKTTSRYGR